MDSARGPENHPMMNHRQYITGLNYTGRRTRQQRAILALYFHRREKCWTATGKIGLWVTYRPHKPHEVFPKRGEVPGEKAPQPTCCGFSACSFSDILGHTDSLYLPRNSCAGQTGISWKPKEAPVSSALPNWQTLRWDVSCQDMCVWLLPIPAFFG